MRGNKNNTFFPPSYIHSDICTYIQGTYVYVTNLKNKKGELILENIIF
jgi:hypothetical protein